jgi:hypothetical protein
MIEPKKLECFSLESFISLALCDSLTYWANLKVNKVFFFCWFKRVLDQNPEQRESKLTVLCCDYYNIN